MSSVLANEDATEVAELRRRLDNFYATTTGYHDFKDQSDKTDFWTPILARIAEVVRDRGTCRILEFGAGRTNFGQALRHLRGSVTYDVQDVTEANCDHLRGQADAVHITDIKRLNGPYDVVFSTFVWEHITDPKAVLEHLLKIMSPGGTLFLACPRYDVPGYIPPSARHYPPARQLLLNLGLMRRRLAARIFHRPGFLIHLDPAVFHRPFFIDADAAHWSSLFDLRAALPRGFRLRRLSIAVRGRGVGRLKHWIWARFLLLFARIDKDV